MNNSFSVKDCVLIEIPSVTDDRGTISVLDKSLPFIVKRIFWLHNIGEGKERGTHALLDGSELLIAVHGSFVVDLDDTNKKVSIMLDSPQKGLLIRPGIWFRTHSYKDGGVSLVLASEVYSKDKYVSDYELFKQMKRPVK